MARLGAGGRPLRGRASRDRDTLRLRVEGQGYAHTTGQSQGQGYAQGQRQGKAQGSRRPFSVGPLRQHVPGTPTAGATASLSKGA